jgi:demethylmenaquinone methyltransferase/2-methoxy-6-polyprenyl-1,4-benzoquinol methylase
MPKAEEVRSMFDRIAGRYDLLNRVMTMGIDRRWRRAAIQRALAGTNTNVLDVCCGTGDITFGLARAGASQAVGLDFSGNMLLRARERATKKPHDISSRIEFVQGDALALPFSDDSFDAITVSFGVRNVENLEQAFREFARVVRPGGTVVCLEITRPKRGLAKGFYGLWFHRVVPRLGGWIAGDREAYTYLPESTKRFPQPPALRDLMERCGLSSVAWKEFAGGIVALHHGTVPKSHEHGDTTRAAERSNASTTPASQD